MESSPPTETEDSDTVSYCDTVLNKGPVAKPWKAPVFHGFYLFIHLFF